MTGNTEKYLNDQFRNYRVHLIRATNASHSLAGHVHDFRVALKRIRAVTKLLELSGDSRLHARIFRANHLNRFFKAGGNLREIHINREILRNYEAVLPGSYDPRLHGFYRQREILALRSLTSFRKSFSFKNLRSYARSLTETIYKIPSGRLEKLIDTFISGDISRIEALIRVHGAGDKLHRIRKLVKRIKYMLELAHVQERVYGKINFTIPAITGLEDRIGYWHDLFVFRKELNWFYSSVRWNPGHVSVGPVIKQAEADYCRMFRETVESIYADFGFQARRTGMTGIEV